MKILFLQAPAVKGIFVRFAVTCDAVGAVPGAAPRSSPDSLFSAAASSGEQSIDPVRLGITRIKRSRFDSDPMLPARPECQPNPAGAHHDYQGIEGWYSYHRKLMGRLSYTSRINGDLALTEYLFGTELGVDNLVARESAVGSGSTHSGKMPPAFS